MLSNPALAYVNIIFPEPPPICVGMGVSVGVGVRVAVAVGEGVIVFVGVGVLLAVGVGELRNGIFSVSPLHPVRAIVAKMMRNNVLERVFILPPEFSE